MDAQAALFSRAQQGRNRHAGGDERVPADLEAALRHEPEVADCLGFGWKTAECRPFAVLLLRNLRRMLGLFIERANRMLADTSASAAGGFGPTTISHVGTGKPQAATIRRAAEAPRKGKANRRGAQGAKRFSERPVGRRARQARAVAQGRQRRAAQRKRLPRIRAWRGPDTRPLIAWARRAAGAPQRSYTGGARPNEICRSAHVRIYRD